MKCSNCSADLLPKSKFCSFCGAEQVVPGKVKASKSKPKRPGAFVWIALFVAAIVVIAVIGANNPEGTESTQLAEEVRTPEEYEGLLTSFEAAISDNNVSSINAMIADLKRPPTEELGNRFEAFRAQAAILVAGDRIGEIAGSELGLTDKFKRLEALNRDLVRDFGASDQTSGLVEEAVLTLVRPLPASMLSENMAGYETLKRLRPDNGEYIAKFQDYQEKSRAEEKVKAERAEAAKRQRVAAILSKYQKRTDKFNDTTFYQHPNAPRYTNSRSTVYLYVGSSSGRYFLRMKTQYAADNWLFVQRVQGYADGSSFLLTSGRFDRDNHTKIWEWLDESPSQMQLERLKTLANATDATLRFEGNTYRRDIQLSAADRRAIRDVLADFEELNSLR